MNVSVFAVVVAVCLTAVVAQRGSSALAQLGTKDLNRYLNDSDFVYRQLQCILARGSCDNTGNQLKFAIPEVLGRDCRSCTPEQARNARRLIDFVQERYPDEFDQIKAKYARRG